MSELDRPTVLLVGEGERMHRALAEALERHSLMVESVATDAVVGAAFAAAPEVLVLLGDAAADGGEGALSRLSEHKVAAMVPVVLLSDDPNLGSRLDAFRHGVVAVVPRTASADGMARQIAELARELPDRPGEVDGDLGEATVDELVALFSQQLRSGILSVSAGGNEGASAQVVLRAGRPVTEAIEELVERLRPLVTTAPGPLRYEFHESPEARLGLLDVGSDDDDEDDAILDGRRVLVIEQNPARADVLVQELRARGALVVVADGDGAGLERARLQDPDVAVIDGSGVDGWALSALRRLRRDARLRWASLLVVDAAELWPDPARGPDMERLAAAIAPLMRPDKELAERARASTSTFDTRLEQIGPARMLRALTGTGLGLGLSVSHPRVRVEIDLAEGLVVGARALTPAAGRELAEGPAALAALVGLSGGRVRIERREAPTVANVMAPVDDAFAAADREEPPVAPSLPPPASSDAPPSRGDEPEPKTSRYPAVPRPGRAPAPSARELGGGQDAERLIGKLELLLERLQKVLPAAEAVARQRPAPQKAPGRARPAPQKPTGPAGRIRVPTPSVTMAAVGPAGRRRIDSPAPDAVIPSPAVVPRPPAARPARRPPAAPGTAVGIGPGPGEEAATNELGAALGMVAAEVVPSAAPDVPVKSPRVHAPATGKGRHGARPRMATLGFGTPVAAIPPPGPAVAPPPPPAPEPPAPSPVELPLPSSFEPEPPPAPRASPPWDAPRPPRADPSVEYDLPEIEATAEPGGLGAGPPVAPAPEAPRRAALEGPTTPISTPTVQKRSWLGRLARLSVGLFALALLLAGAASAAWFFAPEHVRPWAGPLVDPWVARLGGEPSAPTTPELGGAGATDATAVGSTGAGGEPGVLAATAGADAGVDAGHDAGVHAGHDAGVDAGHDAGVDAGHDAGVDAGSDAGAIPLAGALDDELDEERDEEPDDEAEDEAPDADDPEAVARSRRRELIRNLIRTANYQRNQGEHGEAEQTYMRALRLDPNNARVLAGLTRLAMARNQHPSAIRWARRLVQSRPRNPSNHVLLGDAFLAAGNRGAAVTAWRRALELQPGYRSATRRLAR